MSKKVIYGIYDDDDVILKAVKDIREKGVNIDEVYSPFPIHGLDHALGLKPTRLAITSFIYGCTGLSLGLLMMWYMMIQDWPQIIGGKPNFSLIDNLPAFVPIGFELTVFFAADFLKARICCVPSVVGYIPVIRLLRLGAQTGEGV